MYIGVDSLQSDTLYYMYSKKIQCATLYPNICYHAVYTKKAAISHGWLLGEMGKTK